MAQPQRNQAVDPREKELEALRSELDAERRMRAGLCAQAVNEALRRIVAQYRCEVRNVDDIEVVAL